MFNPLEMIELAKAVRNREKTVTITEINFNLKYEDDKVFVSPIKGFVPAGWFDVKRLEGGDIWPES